MLPFADREHSSTEAPKWLDVLENRIKKSHRLAHEIGAGSPCLSCKEKCKGLNLHFWRKICIECKCKKEDHDFVDEDEYSQFEILFGAKRARKTTMKYNTNSKTFDWIPQHPSQGLVVDYLNAIPQSKLPITNSEGANYRKQQLERQLPIYDVNPDTCHNLTDKEIREFRKYVQNLKENVIGQGRIMRFSECFKDISGSCSSAELPLVEPETTSPYIIGVRGQLIIDKHDNIETVLSEKINGEPICAQALSKIDVINHNEAISEDIPNYNNSKQFSKVLKKFSSKSRGDNDSKISEKLKEMTFDDVCESSYMNTPTNSAASGCLNWNTTEPNRTEVETSFPFSDQIYDTENNNGNLRTSSCQGNLGKSLLGSPYHNCINSSGDAQAFQSNNLNNIMASLSNPLVYQKEQIEINIMNASSQELPFTPVQVTSNTPRDNVALVEDSSASVDVTLPKSKVDSYEKHCQKCMQCLEMFTEKDVVVKTDRGGDFELWHAKCFICDICKELLVDLMYFYHEGKVYCGRDYAKIRNIPRCFACDELIFVKEYTQAEGQPFHIKHFCCYLCDLPLGGKQYVPKDDQPVCLECYQTHYGKKCRTCSEIIPVSEQRISLGELHFHLKPECFRCETCLKFLIHERLLVKNEKTYCSKKCFTL